jgi:hypothetical protein
MIKLIETSQNENNKDAYHSYELYKNNIFVLIQNNKEDVYNNSLPLLVTILQMENKYGDSDFNRIKHSSIVQLIATTTTTTKSICMEYILSKFYLKNYGTVCFLMFGMFLNVFESFELTPSSPFLSFPLLSSPLLFFFQVLLFAEIYY